MGGNKKYMYICMCIKFLVGHAVAENRINEFEDQYIDVCLSEFYYYYYL